MKINEIFESIQGEGKHTGRIATFVRLSGCTRKCSFCDTEYHNTINMNLTPEELAKKLIKNIISCDDIIVFTGGEPLLQLKEIIETIDLMITISGYQCEAHIETNGDLLTPKIYRRLCNWFDYIATSPKDKKAVLKINKLLKFVEEEYTPMIGQVDVKVVTDGLELNKKLIKYATMLMPLTTYNAAEDKKIRQRVWKLCMERRLKYTDRLQNIVWGKRRGV